MRTWVLLWSRPGGFDSLLDRRALAPSYRLGLFKPIEMVVVLVVAFSCGSVGADVTVVGADLGLGPPSPFSNTERLH